MDRADEGLHAAWMTMNGHAKDTITPDKPIWSTGGGKLCAEVLPVPRKQPRNGRPARELEDPGQSLWETWTTAQRDLW